MTNLTFLVEQPLFIEVPLPSQESEQSCVLVETGAVMCVSRDGSSHVC